METIDIMESTCPYMIRAIYEWCIDSGYTPYMTIASGNDVDFPQILKNNDNVTFNIGPLATRQLLISNDFVSFYARFGGKEHKVVAPITSVKNIYAKEINEGLMFSTHPSSQSTDIKKPESTVLTSTKTKLTPQKQKTGVSDKIVGRRVKHLVVVK